MIDEKAYLNFISAEEEIELAEIQENQLELVERMSLMAEFIDYVALCENENLNETDEWKEMVDKITTRTKSLGDLYNSLTPLFGSDKPVEDASKYTPAPDMTKKITATENIRIFLGTIIDWVKNVVIRVVEFFKKIFARVTGLTYEPKKDEHGKPIVADISFNSLMKKAQADVYSDKKHAFNSFGSTGTIDLTSASNRLALGVDEKKIKDIVWDSIKHEAVYMEESVLNEKVATSTREVQVVNVDPSSELVELRQALNHFFDLFDNSIGSNGEKLFETDDLQILFKNFQAVKNELEKENTSVFADVGGKLMKIDITSPDRLRDNLIRTQINTQKLKNLYNDIDRIIQSILLTVSEKSYAGSVVTPDVFRLISASAFRQMAEIVKVLDVRLKQTKKLEKSLEKMQDNYTKLTKELELLRGRYMQLGSNFYAPSVIQKQIGDLFVAAKYATQTVMLRFATLSLYSRVLYKTREAIVNLNTINKR